MLDSQTPGRRWKPLSSIPRLLMAQPCAGWSRNPHADARVIIAEPVHEPMLLFLGRLQRPATSGASYTSTAINSSRC